MADIFCSKFCSYYKPSKDKTSYCIGYSIAKHFMDLSNDVAVISLIDIKNMKSTEKLAEKICHKCMFYQDDCDFALGIINALPCGGLVFLSQLLEEGRITLKDIDNIKV